MTTLTTSPTAIQPATPNVGSLSGDQTTQPTTSVMTPIPESSAGSDLRSGQILLDAQAADAAADPNFPDGQSGSAAHSGVAVGESDPRADHDRIDDQPFNVGTGQTPPATNGPATPSVEASLADPMLALLADVLDDLEKTRIANENRLRQLTRNEPDKDGEERGFGLDESHPDVARTATLVDALAKLEHDATLNLQRSMRRHPLGPWVKAQKGIGEKQAARLLAAIGDPYWHTLEDRPRTVSELWAYSGYHVVPARQASVDAQQRSAGGAQTGHPDHQKGDAQVTSVGVAAKRTKGQKANWSTTAKMRAHLIAESCMKQLGSSYRAVYDARKTHTEGRLHAVDCVRCGPSGKPAPAGSPWTDGHRHADALRVTAKAILRDLWREGRRIHEGDPGPP